MDVNESEKQEQLLRAEYKARKRKKRIRKIVTWIIVVALLNAGVIAYTRFRRDYLAQQEALATQSSTREVQVVQNVYTAVIDLSGYVTAYDTQNAKFRSTGTVTGVYVEEGDLVKKGDKLASIDSTSQQASVENLRNQLRSAELQGSSSEAAILRLQLTNAEKNLEYTDIIANFDGIVAEVNVEENDYFEAGDSVMTLVDLSKLKAIVEIDEIDMQYVEEGLIAHLTFDALPGEDIPAEVTYVPMLGEYSDQGIGIVKVELTIENPPASLRTGYSFEGTISVEGDVSMLLIPQAAVTTGRGGVTTVERKTSDGGTESVTVRVKYLGEGYCQVLSGPLAEGDILVYQQSATSTDMFGGGGGGPMRY